MKQVAGVLVLLMFLALGLALATDFRGIASEQAKASQRSRAASNVFRRGRVTMNDEQQRRRLVQDTVIIRVIGAFFVLASLSAVIVVIAKA